MAELTTIRNNILTSTKRKRWSHTFKLISWIHFPKIPHTFKMRLDSKTNLWNFWRPTQRLWSSTKRRWLRCRERSLKICNNLWHHRSIWTRSKMAPYNNHSIRKEGSSFNLTMDLFSSSLTNTPGKRSSSTWWSTKQWIILSKKC